MCVAGRFFSLSRYFSVCSYGTAEFIGGMPLLSRCSGALTILWNNTRNPLAKNGILGEGEGAHSSVRSRRAVPPVRRVVRSIRDTFYGRLVSIVPSAPSWLVVTTYEAARARTRSPAPGQSRWDQRRSFAVQDLGSICACNQR